MSLPIPLASLRKYLSPSLSSEKILASQERILGCGSICTQGFALGWYRSAPLALEAIRRVWIFGSVTTLAVALSVPQGLPWAGIGARRWLLSHPPAVDLWLAPTSDQHNS